MASDEFEMQKNFCVLPWTHLNLKADGEARPCCQASALTGAGAQPLTIYANGIMEIWNSYDMRAVRGTMVMGERVARCTKCWEVEDRGGISRRLEVNASFLHRGGSIEALKDDAVKNDFRRLTPPADYQLDMGNACNLKCRTCFSQYSSKIAADPVHKAWEKHGGKKATESSGRELAIKREGDEGVGPVNRLPAGLPWYKDGDFLMGELLGHPKDITGLQIIGGEPLVIRQLVPIIKHLVENGSPEQVTLGLTTNGTLFDQDLMDLMTGFGLISISISIDGTDEHFEYIRYPGKWADIATNIDRYAAMENVHLSVIPTFQIYNALHFSDVLRYLDKNNLRAVFNSLSSPHFLNASVLPPTARRVAARRLREYAVTSIVAGNGPLAVSMAAQLEEKGDAIDHVLLREFMLYTNDLDRSRAVKFKDVCGETLELMAADGIEWTDELLHAVV